MILEMKYIGKTFPGVVALEGVHFELAEGEVHCLLGENGAGKSTLMKILSGAYQKTTGQILFEGQEVQIKNPMHAQQLGISTIYQELNLIPHLTVGENIYLGREPRLFSGVIDQNKLFQSARAILSDLGVEIDAKQVVRGLGVAQQQMVEVAKALSLDAKILIMDEPTSALSEHEIKELFSTIRKLKSQGVAIVYISHRLEELFEVGDRVTVMRDGKAISTHQTDSISKEQLIQEMVNRQLNDPYPRKTANVGQEVLRVEQLNRRGVLKNISFSLKKGEILGIAGLMGSGRTELARALFGADKIDSGQISVHGELQKIKSPRSAINLGLAYLTEDRKSQGLCLILTVAENICLASLNKFSDFGVMQVKKERSAAQRYCEDLRIKTPGINQKVLYLSGGNQQKVVLSKWLCCQAEVFIFDEPTRGIDVGSKIEIYRLMNQLTEQGVAIIMISSELPEILGMSDRILVMHQGSIAGEFSAKEATQEKILHRALGEEHVN